MANFDDFYKREEVTLGSFGGLNRQGPLCSDKDCFELRNFRLMEDGTLMRREGCVPLARFDAPIRGVYSIEREGERETYVVAGDGVYFVETTGEQLRIGSLDSSNGEVNFVCLEGAVLLLDGNEIRTLTREKAESLIPYIPLYGKDWGVGTGSERPLFEAPNLLTDRIRISILTNPGDRTFYLSDLRPRSIDSVILNGEVFPDGWTYDTKNYICELGQARMTACRYDLIMTMPQSFFGERTPVVGASEAIMIGDAEDARVLFFGGSLGVGRAFMTCATDPSERAVVRAAYPKSCSMMYVTEQDGLTIGDGIHPITGACRHYDRSLIFTSCDTWMTDGAVTSEGKPRLIPVNTTLGCTAEGACAVVGNAPFTIFGRRVLRWNSDTDERNECNAAAVSSRVEPLLPSEFGEAYRIFVDAWRREVWFYRPEDEGRILVYREDDGRWTSFDGFSPRGMFSMGERIGFFAQSTMFLLDEAAVVDTDADGKEHAIEAEMMSQYLDFGHAGRTRRVCGVTVVAACESMDMELCLVDVKGHCVSLPLRGDGGELSVMQARGRGGRFRFVRIGVRCKDAGRLRLQRVRALAVP